jgi:hypothetical protein
VCLTYLSFDEFEKGQCKEKADLDARLKVYQAAEFVSRYWGHYLRAADESIDLQNRAIKIFASQNRWDSMIQIMGYTIQREDPDFDWGSFHADPYNPSILHILALEGLKSMCERLIDGTLVIQSGYVLLHLSSDCARESTTTSPLNFHKDVNLKDNAGWTPLHMAARRGRKEVITLLLEKKADVNIADIGGRTPIQVAITYGQKELVMPLLDFGADPHVRMNNGTCLLHDAAMDSDVETLRLLLDKGVKVNTTANNGQTAVHCAALRTNLDIVTELLNRGADVEIKERNGETALHYAATAFPLEKAMVLTLFKAVCLKQSQGRRPTSPIVSQTAKLDLTPKEVKTAEALDKCENSIDCLSLLNDHYPNDLRFARALTMEYYRGNKYMACDGMARHFTRSAMLDPVNAEITEQEQLRFPGSMCDDCKSTLVGTSYLCTECVDFSLCKVCYMKADQFQHKDVSHKMLVVPGENWNPRTVCEVKDDSSDQI